MALLLVTGASSGLGLATATTLAEAGHDVVVHARDAARLNDETLQRRMRGAVYGDLSRLEETRGVAEQANTVGRYDAVIHNAGTMSASDALAVNTIAPYVLTALMAPPGRCIVLSSSMHLSGTPRTDVLDEGRVSYCDSKLYVTAFAFALAHRWPQMLAHAVDPGWVPTRMGGRSAPDSLTEGHRTQEWLATADQAEIDPRSGAYWHHGQARRAHPAAYDREFQDELLWALEARTGIALPA
ncbi:SDR family NAD(P)-dependent oxidoreductase [Cellulosimicrobium sp. TH-20]|uniref:SDR family NAD(P)-dependent oxidoreductase n=1 Tax=Cellulosimicrobium sp. TH-20 TaxID=1980001 RepID=UPI00119E8ADD|nr:SDR family NAD(P)-dependent oxidoreductase [Cellulosimicrobium sp. TH-20]